LAAKKEFEKAARTLEKIVFESMSSQFTPAQKVNVYINCAEHWFEEEDSVNAETFINKAAHLIHLVDAQELVIRYKVCHSRVLDSKRKFELAANAYYSLSIQEGVDPEDLETLLNMALTCAVLAPAGQMKSIIITSLIKDERSKKLEFYAILESMFYGKVIRKQDVKAFEEGLQPHQKTKSADG
jgi:COP9 signalosome complex subunit 4